MTHPVPNCRGEFVGGNVAAERGCDACESLDGCLRSSPLTIPAAKNAADILIEMGNTFRERNKTYGDNYKHVGEVMMAMFPNGVRLCTAEDFNRWHLFELIIVKLTRFANSGLTHQDSIHDAAVYAAMVESLTTAEAPPISEKTA